MRSPGFRFLIVGLLALLMFIPLFFAGAIVDDRSRYAAQTVETIGREWGGSQTLSGPFLVVPVEATETRSRVIGSGTETSDAGDPQIIEEQVVVRREPVLLLPEDLDATMSTTSEIRRRGIFEVPVYTATVTMEATFAAARMAEALRDGERLIWSEAVLRLMLTGNQGLREATMIEGPDGALDLVPFASDRSGGIEGGVGRLTGTPVFRARFTLNGSQDLSLVPVGRITTLQMRGDWPDPAFRGAFLPDTRTVTDAGYTASWSIPHLARALPQTQRAPRIIGETYAFGTAFLQVNDFYQKAWRAARYGILFIALTFLTVLLIDRKDRPAHPVQYVLIGLAQSIFVLLMVAYAEQIGFLAAYVGSAVATIALLTLFGWTGLRLGRRTPVLAGLLIVLYAVLYLILQSTDLALLAGATLAFGALVLTVILTRNEDWYGPAGPGSGWRKGPDQAKAASSAISTMSPKDD